MHQLWLAARAWLSATSSATCSPNPLHGQRMFLTGIAGRHGVQGNTCRLKHASLTKIGRHGGFASYSVVFLLGGCCDADNTTYDAVAARPAPCSRNELVVVGCSTGLIVLLCVHMSTGSVL